MGFKKYLKALGAQIRKLREERNLSLSDFARRLDRDRQNIHKLEMGELNATVKSLKRVADELNVTMKQLFDFEWENK